VKLVVAPQWKFGNFFGNLKKILGLNRRGYFDFFFAGEFSAAWEPKVFCRFLAKKLAGLLASEEESEEEKA